MKRLLYVLLVSVSLLNFYSCEKENEEHSMQSIPTLQLSDICGVWVDPFNSLYYIAIYPSGRYTYCFNEKMIGSGKCTLDGDILCLNDEYTNASDLIKLNVSNQVLDISGSITMMDSSFKYIDQCFFYSSESLSPSIAGVKKSSNGGLSAIYENLYTEIYFVSDVIFQYLYRGTHRATHQNKTIAYYTWRYVYRKPYTYGIKLNQGNIEVEIYDFPFTYKPNTSTLDLINPNNFKVN